MDQILQSENMQTIAGKVNNAFSAADQNETFEQIGSGDSMSSISGKVKRNFARLTDDVNIEDILVGDSMSTIAQKLKDNFDIVDQQEPEPPTPASNTFSFLHISDTHAFHNAISAMKDLLQASGSKDAFGIITGDLHWNRNSLSEIYPTDFSSWPSGKLLIVPGNHDTWDSWDNRVTRSNSKLMTDWMYGLMGNTVHWGDIENGINVPLQSSYWYQDFDADGGRKVRIIGLDQYELNRIGGSEGIVYNQSIAYYRAYTQAQFSWLIELLADTPSDYHIIIALHTPPLTDDPVVAVEGGNDVRFTASIKPQPPYDEAPSSLLFVNETFDQPFVSEYQNEHSAGSHICEIVKAYLNKTRYQATYINRKVTGANDGDAASVNIDADFRSMDHAPAKFWCYLYGHIHCDICCFLPATKMVNGVEEELYPGQLMLGITSSEHNVPQSTHCDLVEVTPATKSYRINRVTLNFTSGTVLVERIGEQVTNGGRTRDRIVFEVFDMSDD